MKNWVTAGMAALMTIAILPVNAQSFTIAAHSRCNSMKPKLIIGNKNYSSWSLRPWLLLREAGIDFDEQRIVLDAPTSKSEIAEWSPSGRVPVLQLGDLTVWDSLAICETVAERWADKQLWPDDPDERAYARSISAEMHAGFSVLETKIV